MPNSLRDPNTLAKFDSGLADELARWPLLSETTSVRDYAPVDRRSPFEGYTRTLTNEGGIHIRYKELAIGQVYDFLRPFTCVVTTVTAAWLTFTTPALIGFPALCVTGMALLTSWLITRRKLAQWHDIEVQPDRMIVDRKHTFWAKDIGDNWPELYEDAEDPEKYIIAGICGTRFIEYLTVTCFDEADCTPEVLEDDILLAMEQLWGRREVIFS